LPSSAELSAFIHVQPEEVHSHRLPRIPNFLASIHAILLLLCGLWPQQPIPVKGEHMTSNKVMHKRQLVDEVARRSGPWGLTRRQVRDALHGILDVITDEMAEGNAVTIAGFGRFEAKEHQGRRVVGLDGEEYEVESRLVPIV
jgi:nucleoid DNA-binding protein